MEETVHKLAILYADVSGSTRIYEKFGDQLARSSIKICLDLLAEVAASHDGKLVKTIGDEVMCSFTNPVQAALAANDMHQSLQDASAQGKFSIGEIHIKLGWHYGEVHYRGKEIIGEAPVTAQQIINLAKMDEILTSEQSLTLLPDELKDMAHFINSLEAEAYPGKLNVYTVIWDEDEIEEVTKIESSHEAQEDKSANHALMLEYHGDTLRLDADHTRCQIGRSEKNHISVQGRFTSKIHAEIKFRHGSFYLRDMSTNGTAIVYSDGRSSRIHREEILLNSEGSICFGGLPEEDPDGTIHFKCIKKKV